MIHKPECPRYGKAREANGRAEEKNEADGKEECAESGKPEEEGVENGGKEKADGCCDAYLWVMSKGSTKKILSLIKTLPDKESFDDALRNIVGANNAEARKKRRFNKHPRRIPERGGEPFVVLKQPSNAVLTDSSDEYCDITLRKQTREEYDEIDIADHILDKIRLEKPLDKTNSDKVEKDRENSVKRAEKKPKEPPKLYIDRKLRSVIERSVQVLGDIECTLNFGLDPPDDSEEFERRRRRALEFSSRFSRIHLYQLNRHVTDLQEIVRPGTGRSGGKANVFSLNQKFHTANQTIYQGLQAYNKHLPTAVVIGVPEKLREFLKIASDMCDLYKEYSTANPTGEEEEYDKIIGNLEGKCREVSDKVDEVLTKRKLLPQPSVSNSSLSNVKKNAGLRRSKSQRLTMYHTVPIRSDVYWKKAVASLSQKKFDVPSRYKTATFKHRPPPPPPQPVQKHAFVPQKIHGKSEDRRTSQSCRCKPPKSANDIDNVSTLVQAENEREQAPRTKAQSEIMWNLAKGFFNKISKGEQDMTQDEYECILDHFVAMVSNDGDGEGVGDGGKIGGNALEEAAQELLEQKLGTTIENMGFNEFVDKLVESVNGNRKHQCSSGETNVEEGKKAAVEKKHTVSITGAKNAPLICIKDDTSLVEPSEDERPEGEHLKDREKSQSQHELVYRERTESLSKLTRVHKHNLREIQMLPKDTVIRIIEYKLQFHKETKNDCMYKKSGSMSPLSLVERISDKLLDEALISITRDIQVEEILQKIYAHEFK